MILPPHGKNPAKKARPRLFRIWRQPCLIDLPGCKKGIAADENEELFRESTKKYPDRYPAGSTPALFINGRILIEAQPLENFVRVIDDELA